MAKPIEQQSAKGKTRIPKSPKKLGARSTPQWTAVNNKSPSDTLSLASEPAVATPLKPAQEMPSGIVEMAYEQVDVQIQPYSGANASGTKRQPVRAKKVVPSIEPHQPLLSSNEVMSLDTASGDEQSRQTTPAASESKPQSKKRQVPKTKPAEIKLKDDPQGWCEKRTGKGKLSKKDANELTDAIRWFRYGTANPCKAPPGEGNSPWRQASAKVFAEMAAGTRDKRGRGIEAAKTRTPRSAHVNKEESATAILQCPSPPTSSPARGGPSKPVGTVSEDNGNVAVKASVKENRALPVEQSNIAEAPPESNCDDSPGLPIEVKDEYCYAADPTTHRTPPEGLTWNMTHTQLVTEAEREQEILRANVAVLEKRLEVDGLELQLKVAHEAELRRRDLWRKSGMNYAGTGEASSSVTISKENQAHEEQKRINKQNRRKSARFKRREQKRNAAQGLANDLEDGRAIANVSGSKDQLEPQWKEVGVAERKPWRRGRRDCWRPLQNWEQGRRGEGNVVNRASEHNGRKRSSSSRPGANEREEIKNRGKRLCPQPVSLEADAGPSTTKAVVRLQHFRVEIPVRSSSQSNAEAIIARPADSSTAAQSSKSQTKDQDSSKVNSTSCGSPSTDDAAGTNVKPVMRDGMHRSGPSLETTGSSTTALGHKRQDTNTATRGKGVLRTDQSLADSSLPPCVSQNASNATAAPLGPKRVDPRRPPAPYQGRRAFEPGGTWDRSSGGWRRPYDRREMFIPEARPRCVCQLLHCYFSSGLNRKPSLEAFPGTRDEFFANVEQIAQCHGHNKDMILFCEGLWAVEKTNRKVGSHSSTD